MQTRMSATVPLAKRSKGVKLQASSFSGSRKLNDIRLAIVVINGASIALVAGLLFSNAQYSSPLLGSQTGSTNTFCDSSRLYRCQQDIVKDIQLVSTNAASIQYPISQGPPYSPAAKLREQQQRLASPGTCRLVRSNLDCLLLTTPACYENGLQTATQTSDLALRAKRFLEQYQCNEPDTTWQVTFCYRSPEIKNCEDRYGFTAFSSGPLLINSTTCLAYQAFKYCVESHLRLNCKVHEIDMANEYLIDRAGDLAWRCPANSSANLSGGQYGSPAAYNNPYALNNGLGGKLLSPSSYSGSQYEQRPIPTYVGSSQTNGVSLFSGTVRDQPWERFRNPYDDTRFGISRLPTTGGSGDVFDRLVAGGGFDSDTSDCPVKAAPYARECEDTLIEQQRLARDSRDGFELQRRICCSLHQYRDCISRVVLDRCADSSPAAVEILMGARRREMIITCRNYNRDLCSGAISSVLLNPMLLVLASLIASYMALNKPRQLV
uniref:Uncharacterized protein n=1 Tax=Aceria tosichella TaxID=561515 RepID=A0A6G1S7A5_9ACAR